MGILAVLSSSYFYYPSHRQVATSKPMKRGVRSTPLCFGTGRELATGGSPYKTIGRAFLTDCHGLKKVPYGFTRQYMLCARPQVESP